MWCITTGQGMRIPLGAKEGKEKDSPLVPPKKQTDIQTGLNLSPVKLISDFWPKLVVTGHSSNRTLIQR